MRLGLRCGLVVIAGALAGCLTPNPNLPMGNSESGEDSSSGDPSGSPTSNPATSDAQTDGTSAPSTTAGPTTDPDTTDPDTTDTETADTTDTTDTTGPAACGGGNVCAPQVPGGGWEGPVIWAETASSDTPPPCPDAYPDPAFTAFNDLQAPPAICDCDCGAAVGASCATMTLEDHGTDDDCGGAAEEVFMVSATGTCNNLPNEPSAQYWNVDDPGVTGGTCTPIESVEIPELSWNSVSTVCGGTSAAPGACGAGDACVPQPQSGFESRLCIWQSGNLECPNGDYGNRFVRHASETDGRNCQTCTCGNPTGDCTGTVLLWPGTGCTESAMPGPSGTIDIGGGCERAQTSSSYPVESARAGTLSVQNVSCQPSVGTAIGEAEPADPYTLCCISL